MTLLGIDVGTSGCKAALFSPAGDQLAAAYRELDSDAPRPGWAQFDAWRIWDSIKSAIREVTAARPSAAIKALAVSSLGEAVVPVSADRRILGPSILNFDVRGAEFLPDLAARLPAQQLYATNGNTLGNHYSLTKLKWLQKYQPDLYEQADYFLHWSPFVSFMLGAEAAVDYSLANRTLLFDLHAQDWSEVLLAAAGLDRRKLPPAVPSGTVVGWVSKLAAAELNLPEGAPIVAGAHDQCANALGCGVIDPGSAVYGMGTFHCLTPVFREPPSPALMIDRGLNTEHHAVHGRYVSFLYNQGGSLVKWFRDTFAAQEYRQAAAEGRSVYPALFAELSQEPGEILVLPHFTTTGPPSFLADSAGVICGLHLETTRGEILRGIIEGAAYYLREIVDALPGTGISIGDFRAVGGGSKSDIWLQTVADIFGRPVTRPAITEAGALGAAMIAGIGAGVFADAYQAVEAMVNLDRVFEPVAARRSRYDQNYARYRQMWPLLSDFIRHEGKN